MSDAPLTRFDVCYSGHVQGVGFRYTARQVAGRHQVGGFVRNLPDGRVEVVAEGRPAEVRSFLDDLAAAMEGYIRDTAVQEKPATGSFVGFEVRR